MKITTLTDLAREYERGKIFKIRTNDSLIDLSIAEKSIAELDHLLSYYKVYSVDDREAIKTEWLLLTEVNGESYVPSSGICWACNEDIVQHYIDTEEFSGSHCLMCNYDFINDD